MRAALPMLTNAALCWAIHHWCGIGHEFGLGICLGGSLTMALRDWERSSVVPAEKDARGGTK